jgi:glutamyl-tRNA synthetase
MSLERVVANFSLDRITKSPAGLDPDKIFWFQDHYMRALPQEERIDRMLPFLEAEGLVKSPVSTPDREIVRRVDSAAADRLKLLSDVVRYGGFFFRDRPLYDKQAIKNLTKEGAAGALERLRKALAEVENFNAQAIESAVKSVGESTGQGGKINHLLRGAATGQAVGPGVYECAEILGKDKTIRNIDHTLERLARGDLA